MHRNKGGFSLIYLVAIIYLTLFAQLTLYHLRNDYQRSYSYAQSLQQRRLCSSIMNWLINNQKEATSIQFTYTFPPAKEEVTINGKHDWSKDDIFDYYYTMTTSGKNSHGLYRLGFYPLQELKAWGTSYMFISKYTPTGTNYLSNGSLYTSKGSFTMPAIDFLADKAAILIDMQAIHENGFPNNFYYLKQALTLTYSSTAKTTTGNSLIACARGITLQKNFRATGRLILISNESITLQDNVNLSNVLIIAKGNVVIGKNCKIKGIVFSSSTIKFQGSGTFTHDASVVADYVSPIFIA